DHTRLRRVVAAAFSPRRADLLRADVRRVTDALIAGILPRGRADLIGDFAYPLATTVLCQVLGVPTTDLGVFRQWTSNAVTGPDGDRGVTGEREPGRYLRALVAARRREPGDDVLSALIEAGDRELLSESELLSMCFLLLVAGHENSVGLIGNGITTLLRHPDQLALLRARPDLLDSAVEEVLRYDGPMDIAAWRYATEPVELGGVRIPAGHPVLVCVAGANHDPARFTDADRFDITREDNPHLGFGHGIHHCLGAPLARVEVRVALEALVHRLPGLALARPLEEIPRQPSLFIRGLYELPVTFTPAPSPGGPG
ncbi:MAG TPA: cytochrome P450, partial [Thermomonospora sp.]|nr:cytochrome P450 [Thermomonospora sp.]